MQSFASHFKVVDDVNRIYIHLYAAGMCSAVLCLGEEKNEDGKITTGVKGSVA